MKNVLLLIQLRNPNIHLLKIIHKPNFSHILRNPLNPHRPVLIKNIKFLIIRQNRINTINIHKKFHSFLASLKGTHRNESLELEAFSLYNISQGNIYYKARGGELQTSVTHRLNQYKKQCKCSFFKHT